MPEIAEIRRNPTTFDEVLEHIVTQQKGSLQELRQTLQPEAIALFQEFRYIAVSEAEQTWSALEKAKKIYDMYQKHPVIPREDEFVRYHLLGQHPDN